MFIVNISATNIDWFTAVNINVTTTDWFSEIKISATNIDCFTELNISVTNIDCFTEALFSKLQSPILIILDDYLCTPVIRIECFLCFISCHYSFDPYFALLRIDKICKYDTK